MPGKYRIATIPFSGTPSPTISGLNHVQNANGWFEYQDAIRGNWTPTLSATTTPPNLGATPTKFGDFLYHGGWVKARFLLAFGGAGLSAGSGIYEMGSLPFAAEIASVGGSVPVGQVHLRDVGTASKYWTCVMMLSGVIRFSDDNGVEVTNAAPWTWASGDSMRGELYYKADE